MGSIAGPANARFLTSATLVLFALLAALCVAAAAPADFSERDLSPPQRARTAASLKSPHSRNVEPAAYGAEQGSDQEESADDEPAAQGDTQGDTNNEGIPAASAKPSAAAKMAPAPNKAAVSSGGDLNYVIREGDSIGAVAAMFHLSPQEIFRRNHLGEDSTLHVGQVLHIPNPYVAEVRDLQRQIGQLQAAEQSLEARLEASGSSQRALDARIEELTAINRGLEHDVTVLPWWRRATTVAVTAAAVLLGIALLSLVQWFLIRWRFAAVAQANEKLSKLDQRYRVLL